MTISFREVADRCDAFESEVAAITEARKEFWAEVRDQLPARDVKALKAAIKLRKRRRVDLEGEEDHDQRTAEILLEIERGTEVALAHARRANDLPPHDEDGVLIEEPAARSGAAGEPATVGRGAVSAVALPPDLSEPSSVPSDDEAGQGEGWPLPSSVAPPTISDVPATGPATALALGADGMSVTGDAARAGASTPDDDASPTVSNPAAGAAEQGSGAAPNTAPEPDLSSFAPMAGEDGATTTNGGDHEVATSDITNIDRIDFRSEDPDDMSRRASGSVPISQSGASLSPDAPGSSPGPDPVETPGAIHSGEMPDLPDFLRRVA